jgi:lysophospholipase L1-like esterase
VAELEQVLGGEPRAEPALDPHEGVAAQARLNQGDGIHPNAAGVEAIVDRIIGPVEQLIAAARD